MSPHVLPDSSHLDTYEQVASLAQATRAVCGVFVFLLNCQNSFLPFSLLVQGVLFSSFCLDRNLQDMMHLWGEIFNR